MSYVLFYEEAFRQKIILDIDLMSVLMEPRIWKETFLSIVGWVRTALIGLFVEEEHFSSTTRKLNM